MSVPPLFFSLFFFNDTATTEIYTLSLHDALPILTATWGNEISVLVGDCLFAHALKLAASFPTPDICRAVAAATNTVCSGEILQTQRRRDFQFCRREYFKALEMKTGELFALSCEL